MNNTKIPAIIAREVQNHGGILSNDIEGESGVLSYAAASPTSSVPSIATGTQSTTSVFPFTPLPEMGPALVPSALKNAEPVDCWRPCL